MNEQTSSIVNNTSITQQKCFNCNRVHYDEQHEMETIKHAERKSGQIFRNYPLPCVNSREEDRIFLQNSKNIENQCQILQHDRQHRTLFQHHNQPTNSRHTQCSLSSNTFELSPTTKLWSTKESNTQKHSPQKIFQSNPNIFATSKHTLAVSSPSCETATSSNDDIRFDDLQRTQKHARRPSNVVNPNVNFELKKYGNNKIKTVFSKTRHNTENKAKRSMKKLNRDCGHSKPDTSLKAKHHKKSDYLRSMAQITFQVIQMCILISLVILNIRNAILLDSLQEQFHQFQANIRNYPSHHYPLHKQQNEPPSAKSINPISGIKDSNYKQINKTTDTNLTNTSNCKTINSILKKNIKIARNRSSNLSKLGYRDIKKNRLTAKDDDEEVPLRDKHGYRVSRYKLNLDDRARIRRSQSIHL